MQQRRKLWAYLCTGVVLILLVAAEETVILRQWHENLEAQQRRSAIKEEILRIQRLVADIDNGFRGYVLMRQSIFLAPMVAAEAALPQAVHRLSQLTEKSPSLQGGVQVLRGRLDELVDTKRRLALQLDSGHQEEVMAYVRAGNGVVLSKTIVSLLDDLEAKLARDIGTADSASVDVKAKTMWQLIAAQTGAVALGILIMEILITMLSLRSPRDLPQG
ncbi:MAG TPA: CHASE3 domain-containing protein [Nitrospira sp.]|nr:CHASE3 domain-containing protein [Nitrospira sp.]